MMDDEGTDGLIGRMILYSPGSRLGTVLLLYYFFLFG